MERVRVTVHLRNGNTVTGTMDREQCRRLLGTVGQGAPEVHVNTSRTTETIRPVDVSSAEEHR